MRPCLKSTPSFTGTSSSSGGLSFSTLSSCTPSTSGSCLGTTPACQRRKCVAFEADACLETVFVADEWDRTPTEPARKLSYQDLLELKEIQRSLPRANQPPDHLAGRAGKQYLTTVPIGLLPLLPSTSPYSAAPPPSLDHSPVRTGTTTPNPSSNFNPISPFWTTPRPPNASTTSTPGSNWTPIQSPYPPTSPTSPSSPSVDPSGETRWVSFNPDSPRDPGSLAASSPPVRSPIHPQRSAVADTMGTPPASTYPPNCSSSGPSPAPSYPPPSSSAQPQKQKPRFAFLPLLDSPPAVAASTSSPSPTSTTIPTLNLPVPRHTSSSSSSSETPASSSSSSSSASSSKWSNSSKAYSTGDADPPYFQLPPPKRTQRGGPSPPSTVSSGTTHGSRFSAYYNREGGDWEEQRQHRSFGSVMSAAGRSRSKSPSPSSRSANGTGGGGGGTFGRSHPAFQAVYPAGVTLSPSSSRASSRHPSPVRPEASPQVQPPITPKEGKRKNVMVINGIEYDLGGDEEEEEVDPPKPKQEKEKEKKEKKKNVMVINGIEIDLDDDEEEEEEEETPLTPISSKAPSLPPSSPTSSFPSSSSPTPVYHQPSSPIAQPRPISPAVSSRSPSTSPKSGSTRGPNGLPTPPPSTSPSPVPSWRALPMEVVEQKQEEQESPFVGLHAPVTFKRAPRPAPAPAPSAPSTAAAPQLKGLAISTGFSFTSPSKATSPVGSRGSSGTPTPTPSSPVRGRSGSGSSSGVGGSPVRGRRGSVCGQQSMNLGFDPRASPRLVPRA